MYLFILLLCLPFLIKSSFCGISNDRDSKVSRGMQRNPLQTVSLIQNQLREISMLDVKGILILQDVNFLRGKSEPKKHISTVYKNEGLKKHEI